MSDTPEEKAHWRSVIKAFDGYMQYHLSANHARRLAFLQLPKDQRTLLEDIGYREKLDAVDEGIRQNEEFIQAMIADPVFEDMLYDPEASDTHDEHQHQHQHDHAHDHDHDHDHGQSHSHEAPHTGHTSRQGDKRVERDASQDKVRSTLRSFVRDWSVEGSKEREACYDPCLEALERHFDGTERGEIEVLVPGCGLGRLAMEVAARGFASQANEFSAYMLLASNFVLNQTTHPKSHSIFPFLHSFSNHKTTSDHLLRRIQIPDICPADILGDGQGGAFSLVAGDFEEIYGGDSDAGKWGAVITCFFIDCARNVLSYLRIIHSLLADDGVWINIGPLLWHFENSPSTSAKGEGSIELSLDEVKALAAKVGFEIKEEKMISSSYTGIPDNMLKHEYEAAFWTATKRRAS